MTRIGLLLALLAAAAVRSDAMHIHLRMRQAPTTNTSITPSANANATTGSTAGHSATAGSAAFSPPSGPVDPSKWHMTKVTAYQARVQGNMPAWDAQHEAWGGSYGADFAAKYRSVLDSVNTASIEGALMYLQAEGINAPEQSVKCQRKNSMQYVVFYQLTIVQPTPALAFYAGTHEPSEYCPFVAMDSGMCTPSGSDIPDTCKQFEGLGGQPKLGPCVGANEQSTDPRAPYPGNYWFSFPNSCPTKAWTDKAKDDACRTQYPGGLCAFGTEPDGVNCTFSYSILGYLNIDDLVGITDGTALSSGAKFKNFTEFCQAGNVEFSATNTGSGFTVAQSIPFWQNPGDQKANAARTQKMIDTYNKLVDAPMTKHNGTMTKLPDLKDIKNPPCYMNSKECATAANGCKRTLYAQLCEVCSSPGDGCVAAPASFKFPDLPVPKAPKNTSSKAGSGDDESGVLTPDKKSAGSGKASGNQKTNVGSTSRLSAVSLAVVGLVLVTML